MRIVIATLLCVCCAALARAEAPCIDLTTLDAAQLASYSFDAPGPDAATRDLQAGRVYLTGAVRIVIQPIFDTDNPAESRAAYRWANRLHMQTRPHVVREALTFREGEPVTVSAILESERVLRAKPFLYDARVIPRRLCGERLDIDVVARDVWTLTPDVDFSRTGGENSYGYGLTDTNLLGSGRTLSVFFEKDPDRRGEGVFYLNPNVAGSRIAFETLFADYNDGSRRVVDVGQPFYSLDSRRAFGVRAEETDQEQALFLFGDRFAQFGQDLRSVSVSGGISSGVTQGTTWRWLAGYTYEERTFSPLAGEVPPDPLPEDRTLGYPWIGFASIEDRFGTAVNVDRIGRTEDLELGRQYEMRVGWSDSSFGGDDQRRLVTQGSYRDGLLRSDKHLIFYGALMSGYWNFDTNRSEQVSGTAYATYRQQQTGRFSLAATLVGRAVHNLPTDQQLLGGGDTGLRGYPSRYQWGNRSYLVSVEQRYISDIYIARIVRLGFAAFFDAGRTWFADSPSSGGFGTLADVGFGLRFESTRTRQDRVLHVDFAFPLVDGPNVESMQILLVVKERL